MFLSFQCLAKLQEIFFFARLCLRFHAVFSWGAKVLKNDRENREKNINEYCTEYLC